MSVCLMANMESCWLLEEKMMQEMIVASWNFKGDVR